MKRYLLIAILGLALFSCSKDVEFDTPDYMWVSGDEVTKQSFIMSVASIYGDTLDASGKKQVLECQVYLGDTSKANLLGTRMEVSMNFDDKTDGVYNVGSSCKGVIRYYTCSKDENTSSNLDFGENVYELTDGTVYLLNDPVDENSVKMTFDVKGKMQKNDDDAEDASAAVVKNITLTGDLVAKR